MFRFGRSGSDSSSNEADDTNDNDNDDSIPTGIIKYDKEVSTKKYVEDIVIEFEDGSVDKMSGVNVHENNSSLEVQEITIHINSDIEQKLWSSFKGNSHIYPPLWDETVDVRHGYSYENVTEWTVSNRRPIEITEEVPSFEEVSGEVYEWMEQNPDKLSDDIELMFQYC